MSKKQNLLTYITDIAEILLKVALNTINQSIKPLMWCVLYINVYCTGQIDVVCIVHQCVVYRIIDVVCIVHKCVVNRTNRCGVYCTPMCSTQHH
jgi:hypothetical protein